MSKGEQEATKMGDKPCGPSHIETHGPSNHNDFDQRGPPPNFEHHGPRRGCPLFGRHGPDGEGTRFGHHGPHDGRHGHRYCHRHRDPIDPFQFNDFKSINKRYQLNGWWW